MTIKNDIARLAELRRLANSKTTVPSAYLLEVLDAYEIKLDERNQRDEIEDVLAVLARDIDDINNDVGIGKHTTAYGYANMLSAYIRKGLHWGAALKYEAAMEDQKCTPKT